MVIFDGLISAIHLATPGLVCILFLIGVRDFSIIGFFYYVIAVWRLATLTSSDRKSLLLQPNVRTKQSCASCKNLCCNKLAARCVCLSTTFWWQAALVGSPLIAVCTFVLTFPSANNVLKGSQKYLDWVGLVSDRNEVTTLIHDHVVIMIVADFHGFVTRFCAGPNWVS